MKKRVKISKKKLDQKKLLFIIGGAILIVALLIGGIFLFKKDDEVEEKKPNVNVVNPDKKEETPKTLQIVDVNSNSRPYAIVINNISTARPLQSGLQDAYIIYEFIAEGGITRYIALFLDQNTERIGSIRSARHYFLDYALENDAIFVHHGQSTQALADFSKINLDRIVVDNNKTGWRDKSLKVASEHTLFTSMEKLKNGLGKKRTTRNGDLLLDYSIDSINLSSKDNVRSANKVSIKYSSNTTSSYEYDSEAKVYKRYVNGKTHTDYVTKKQYTFKNIITYQVKNYTLDDPENKGRQGLDNIGNGIGYFISEGYAVPIKWEKDSRNSQTKYYFADGSELKVNDGNTFIQVQPKGLALDIS